MPTYNPYLTQGIHESPFFVAFVNGDTGANSYPIAAGKTGFLFDFNTGKFWIKETDQNGLPKPIRSFPFTEETPKQQAPVESGGVSKDEFIALSNNVAMLSDSVNKLLKDLGGDK